MKAIGNILWLIFGGIELALGYLIAAVVACVFIITIPLAIPALRIGLFCLWPFGRTLVRKEDAGVGSALGNLVWLVFFGWWLALGHLIAALIMAITIIGIPFAVAHMKLAGTALWPFGSDVVAMDAVPAGSTAIVVSGRAAPPAESTTP